MDKEIKDAVNALKEVKDILKKFSNEEEGVEYFVKETGLSKKECTSAYNFIIKTNFN